MLLPGTLAGSVMNDRPRKIKVCYVLSYHQPNYVRSLALLGLLRANNQFEVFEARNKTKGLLRYAQTILQLILCRIKYRPDVYILGFRGYEIFLPVRILTIGKPLIYDEFINLYDWFVLEHKKIKSDSFTARLIMWYSRLTLKLSDSVVTDTSLNAEFSSRVHGLERTKFTHIYVGTDEATFTPGNKKTPTKNLEVLFYGNMLPLHGVEHMLDAMRQLQDKPVHFTIIGGKKTKYETVIHQFLNEHNLSNVTYKNWVPYHDLPTYIGAADLCLGGPFGGTSQASKVITGKTFQFLAMAKPVLIGHIDEEVGFVDGKNCLKISQASEKQLREKIVWAIQHRGELEQIGLGGKRLYDEKFSKQAQHQKLTDIIAKVTRV